MLKWLSTGRMSRQAMVTSDSGHDSLDLVLCTLGTLQKSDEATMAVIL
jgi:hypothetical protein